MAPLIRIGMIGLSKSAATSWAEAAHLPYLLSSHGRNKYEIAALCNSSVESAKKAVEAFGLPPSTKTYGDAADLAADPEVDLVVCSVRVDRHYETIRPSLATGKNVYCEWPLASNLEHAGELVNLAHETGSKTMIGTQRRASPLMAKIREVLEQGRIGKILSSEPIYNTVSTNDVSVLDSVQSAIGEFHNIKSTLQIQRPNVPVKDTKTKETQKVVQSEIPDLIIATGTLKESPIAQEGATLYFRLRRGQPFPNEDPLIWTINGEKGELRITSPGGTALQSTPDGRPVLIELHDHETNQVSRVDWDWADWLKDVAAPARDISVLYEEYANGGTYPTFDDALKLHEKLAEIMAGWTAPATM
nr:galactose/lactose metabolism regulatory protein gal80 [Quercus suber]